MQIQFSKLTASKILLIILFSNNLISGQSPDSNSEFCLNDCTSLICQDATVSILEIGHAFIGVSNVVLNDSCFSSINLSPQTFNCGNLGANKIVATAADALGNISTCQSIITVVDDEAPVCGTRNITVNLNQYGNAVIRPKDIDLNSYDGCSLYLDSVWPNRFDCRSAGRSVQVTLIIKDYFNNRSACKAKVKVIDKLGVCSGKLSDDGIQNADELGVDCGGTFCAPCGQ